MHDLRFALLRSRSGLLMLLLLYAFGVAAAPWLHAAEPEKVVVTSGAQEPVPDPQGSTHHHQTCLACHPVAQLPVLGGGCLVPSGVVVSRPFAAEPIEPYSSPSLLLRQARAPPVAAIG